MNGVVIAYTYVVRLLHSVQTLLPKRPVDKKPWVPLVLSVIPW